MASPSRSMPTPTLGSASVPPPASQTATQVSITSPAGSDPTDRWLTDRIVTVTVGKEEKKWAVHEKLLSSKSQFFNQYFNSADSNVNRDEMKLPDEDPKLFGLFIRWLYGNAFATSGGTRPFRFQPPDGKDVTVRDYLALYVLGGKFGMVGLRNAAIDALYTHFGEVTDFHESPNFEDIDYIFTHTTPDAPIRRFLIVHALFYLFSKGRRNAPLPADWGKVLCKNGEIGWAMIRMLADWNWTMGVNAPPMKVKARYQFHEKEAESPKIKPERPDAVEMGTIPNIDVD